MFERIGFIGTGNMGAALAAAAVKGIGGDNVLLANRTAEKAAALAESLGCVAGSNARVATECDLIFLGVKPQMMEAMFTELAPVLAQRKDDFVLVVSQSTCSHCAAYKPKLKNISRNYGIDIYFFHSNLK